METYNKFDFSIKYYRDDAEYRASLIDISDAKTLLDIGCADGWFPIHFSKLGLEVSAIDYSEKSIELTKQCINRCIPDSNIDLYYLGILDFSINKKFDITLLFSVLNWNKNIEEIINKVCSLTKKRIYIECNFNFVPEYFDNKDSNYYIYSFDIIRELLWKNGFGNVKIIANTVNGRNIISASRYLKDLYFLPWDKLDEQALSNGIGRATACGATWKAIDKDNNFYHIKLQNKKKNELLWLKEQNNENFLCGDEIFETNGLLSGEFYIISKWLNLEKFKKTDKNIKIITKALNWLHEKGYAHCDLGSYHTPMVNGIPKIIDFGHLTKIGTSYNNVFSSNFNGLSINYPKTYLIEENIDFEKFNLSLNKNGD